MKKTAIAKQGLFDAETRVSYLTFYYHFKELVKENIAMDKISQISEVPLLNYIEKVCCVDRRTRKAGNHIESTISSAENLLNEMEAAETAESIREMFYYEKMSTVFEFYYYGLDDFLKFADHYKSDEHGLPDYFPCHLSRFIQEAYPTFVKICNTQESRDLSDRIAAMSDERAYESIGIVCAHILTEIFLGEIKEGADITDVLFKNVHYDTQVPEKFTKLCEEVKGKYVIKNTDWKTQDFQMAVFDLISFFDYENKVLFNNKMNQYLQKMS